MNPKELYTNRIKTLTNEIYQLNKHNRLIVILELTAVAMAIGCIVAYTMWSNTIALAMAVMFIAAYVAIRWRDSRDSRMSEEKESLRKVYQKELNYLNGDFSSFLSGEQYVNPTMSSLTTLTSSGRSHCSIASIALSLLAVAIFWQKS